MRIGCIRTRGTWVRLVLAGGLVGLFVLALAAQPPVAQAADASSDAAGVTVPAPGAGPGATVTVSKTTNMVNETVQVSWAGFRPSTDTRLANAGDSLDATTQRPVRVYECRGAEPKSSSDCYGSLGFNGVAAGPDSEAVPEVSPYTYLGQADKFKVTPDGPANWQDNVTRADGTGEVAIQ